MLIKKIGIMIVKGIAFITFISGLVAALVVGWILARIFDASEILREMRRNYYIKPEYLLASLIYGLPILLLLSFLMIVENISNALYKTGANVEALYVFLITYVFLVGLFNCIHWFVPKRY